MTAVPQFEDGKNYLMSGATLNAMVAAINARTPIAGQGLTSQETPQGVVFSVNLPPPAAPPTFSAQFCVDGTLVTATVYGTLGA